MTDDAADPPAVTPAAPRARQRTDAEVRAARLKAALRDNLSRRKAQGRARRDSGEQENEG